MDKFIYEKPDRIEIQVEASTFHDDYNANIDIQSLYGERSDEKYVKTWQSYLSEITVGKYPSDQIVSTHIDLDSIKSSIVYELQNSSKQGYCTEQTIPEPEIVKTSLSIPKWIKNNAGWWADGIIDDEDFATGIQYLIKTGVIVVR